MYKRGFMKDMDKTTLLKMRDNGMTNAEIAVAVGCSQQTIYNLIGSMPMEMRKRIFQENGARNLKAALERNKGGCTVERKMQSFKPKRKEADEPVKAVLAVKKTPIRLSGAFMHYTICPGREMIDVETEEGRVLMQIPAEKLEAFIEELTAIRKNIGQAEPMRMWG